MRYDGLLAYYLSIIARLSDCLPALQSLTVCDAVIVDKRYIL